MQRLTSHTKEEEDLNCIAIIAGECVRLLNMYFSITSSLPEVREVEIGIMHESLRQTRIETNEVNVNDRRVVVDPTVVEDEDESEHRRERSIGEITEHISDDEEGAVRDAIVENGNIRDKAINELSDENERLKVVVNQLLRRIQALETSNTARQCEIEREQMKHKSSTPIDERSVQNKNEARQSKNKQNFYEWIKQRYSSMESISEDNRKVQSSNQDKTNKKQVVEVDKPKSNRLPVYKWSVRYDGLDNGRRLNEFLKEVEFNARSEGFTEAELFVSAHHLFTRKARAWFMEVNGNSELETWENLTRELKSEFLPEDIDYQYERLAGSRRQGPREKFQDYYLDMVKIFRSMSKQWDDARKFDVLFRNTRPDCRTAMLAANVTSIPKMREFGKRFDSINWQVYVRKENRFSRPNPQIEEIQQQRQNNSRYGTNNRYQIEQKGGYQGRNFNPNYKPGDKLVPPEENGIQGGNNQRKFPQKQMSQDGKQNQNYKQFNPKPGPSGTSALQKIVKAYIPIKRGVCFNCHEEGHRSKDCRQEKHEFCEHCGFPGFPTNNCPFCQSKNVQKTAQ